MPCVLRELVCAIIFGGWLLRELICAIIFCGYIGALTGPTYDGIRLHIRTRNEIMLRSAGDKRSLCKQLEVIEFDGVVRRTAMRGDPNRIKVSVLRGGGD